VSRTGENDPVADRRLGSSRRPDIDEPVALGELDAFLDLVATTIGARAVGFTVVDGRVERASEEHAVGADVGSDGRWPVVQQAVLAPVGRASGTIHPGEEPTRLPSFCAVDAPVTVAAIAVHGADEQRIGAIVAHWVAAAVPEGAWVTLELAASHVGTVLDLRAESDEYHRFIDLSPDPVFVFDEDGVIERANPAMAELLQVEALADLHGRLFLKLIDPEDRARAANQIARLLASARQRLSLELTLRSDAGREVPVSIVAAHLRGVRRRFQCSVHDLTDRIKGEELRSRLSEQLARAERLDVVGQLAGGLAHDLNNLFAVVVANLELADESLAQQDDVGAAQVEARSELAEVRVAIDRAARLTGRLLDVGRQAEPHTATAQVSVVLGGVRSLMERTLPRGIELCFEVGEGLPEITGDASQIERALLNLVLNGRDAIGDAGTITVRAAAIRRTSSESGEVPDGAVRLEVIDDGAGMDERTRSRAFEPLFTTKGDRGSGLGLPAVAALVTALDGEIAIESAPGDGTQVTLELPAAAGSPTPAPVGTDRLVAGARILLVDAGDRTRHVIERMLVVDGYRVSAATTGSEALENVAEEAPALVITDLALPDGGVALLDRLHRERPDLPTLAIAAIDAPSVFDVSPVLVKPFSHTRLLDAVRQLLRGAGPSSRTA
jgi:PAS domain S-box-containing protein